jgi:hypothetical protein
LFANIKRKFGSLEVYGSVILKLSHREVGSEGMGVVRIELPEDRIQ